MYPKSGLIHVGLWGRSTPVWKLHQNKDTEKSSTLLALYSWTWTGLDDWTCHQDTSTTSIGTTETGPVVSQSRQQGVEKPVTRSMTTQTIYTHVRDKLSEWGVPDLDQFENSLYVEESPSHSIPLGTETKGWFTENNNVLFYMSKCKDTDSGDVTGKTKIPFFLTGLHLLRSSVKWRYTSQSIHDPVTVPPGLKETSGGEGTVP